MKIVDSLKLQMLFILILKSHRTESIAVKGFNVKNLIRFIAFYYVQISRRGKSKQKSKQKKSKMCFCLSQKEFRSEIKAHFTQKRVLIL